jgi:predicted Zn-dependent protease
VVDPKILPHEADYLAQMTVRRWPDSNMPLKVFVIPANQQHGFDAAEADLILKGFNQWLCRESTLRLTTVNDYMKADIVILRVGYEDLPPGFGGHTLYDYDPKNHSSNPPVVRSRTNLYCASGNFADLSDSEKDVLYTLAMHEAGHAFGLDGHSSDPDDVMFAKSTITGLSRRDLATIVHVYPKLSR